MFDLTQLTCNKICMRQLSSAHGVVCKTRNGSEEMVLSDEETCRFPFARSQTFEEEWNRSGVFGVGPIRVMIQLEK